VFERFTAEARATVIGARQHARRLGLLGRGGRWVVYGWSTGTPTELDEAELARRDIIVVRFRRPDDLRPSKTRRSPPRRWAHWCPWSVSSSR
jgi:hypothetical protein